MGDWRTHETHDGEVLVLDSAGQLVASVEQDYPEPSRTTGALIAAAPTLLRERDALQAKVGPLSQAFNEYEAENERLQAALSRCVEVMEEIKEAAWRMEHDQDEDENCYPECSACLADVPMVRVRAALADAKKLTGVASE